MAGRNMLGWRKKMFQEKLKKKNVSGGERAGNNRKAGN